MAVYARGYRTYDGDFRGPPVAWTIFREGVAQALRRKGFRWILNITAFILLATAGMIYIQVIVEKQAQRLTGGMVRAQLMELDQIIHGFHATTMFLVSLGAVLVGSGLVADDLRTRALSLFLVRPIRPVDYMLGKALVLPALLIPLALLPGLVLWLLVGLWQPPGETWTFLQEHSDIAWNVTRFYLVGAAQLTGLLLLLSSRTPRRGLVIGLSAAILFGGPVLRAIGRLVLGPIGTLLKSLDLPNNMLWSFTRDRREWQFEGQGGGGRWGGTTGEERWLQWQPDPTVIYIVCFVLLAAGLYFTWRRARSVEVDA
ncbi:MAG: hypothetical protein QNJ90_14710 [Planctomycetota bacterium]|nr:hypothetical protein [Planctomycetota bacterium]